ncbi:DUF916 and DUF3324 domain-containing protein [Enterococcus sp. AZ196]|uniref:DUF916 and DUF3324 domain-containing protein n=1 Tax=Enterococcus sp. AZ196 TaxID=2774659 RepID=UPI003D275057
MKRLSQLFFTLAFILTVTPAATAFAEEEGESAGYSVAKVAPTTPQVDEASSFYDLLVKPGDEIEIQAEVTNHSSSEAKIKMGDYTTYTNSNGEINYSAPLAKKKKDKSLKIPFSDIAEIKGASAETLSPGEKKVVAMKINVPQDAPEGVILGSWYFEKEDQASSDPKKEEKKKTGINIENRFAYAMAVKLTVQKEIAAPNMNLLKVFPDLNNYQKVINANVQNDQPAIISNLNFTGKVTKKGSSRALITGQLKDRKMAPNSNFNVPFFLGKEPLKAGKYTLHLKATTTDSKWEKKTWQWTKDFTITREEADKLNEEAINDPEPEPNYLIYLLIAIIGLLVILLLVVLFRKKKEK